MAALLIIRALFQLTPHRPPKAHGSSAHPLKNPTDISYLEKYSRVWTIEADWVSGVGEVTRGSSVLSGVDWRDEMNGHK